MTTGCLVSLDRESEELQVSMGLTPVTAEKIMRRDFPEVEDWMVWNARGRYPRWELAVFLGEGLQKEGTIGSWKWERLPNSYGTVGMWSGTLDKPERGAGWFGVIRVTDAQGKSFLLFSYLRLDMSLGQEYLVSTGDMKWLDRFAKDVTRALRPRRRKSKVRVNVVGPQPDFHLSLDDKEEVYLPDALHQDILSQVDGFFGNRKMYKQMGIPHKRGFLFAGAPGTGKTMLIRNLIRHIYRKYKASAAFLSVSRRTDLDDLRQLFNHASDKNPALLILEDVESLCRESSLTRSELLGELDGISQHSGILLIATANNPQQIDPALLHRPSRFDRVWVFPVPDSSLREKYIREQFKLNSDALIRKIARETDDWSFAYIKELRNTAGILAIRDGAPEITEDHFRRALKLLGDQFAAGKTGYANAGKSRREVGFGFHEDSQEVRDGTVALGAGE